MVYAIIGILAGFLAAFLSTKHVIKKQGAGQLKVCNDCPYRAKPKPLRQPKQTVPAVPDDGEEDLEDDEW